MFQLFVSEEHEWCLHGIDSEMYTFMDAYNTGLVDHTERVDTCK